MAGLVYNWDIVGSSASRDANGLHITRVAIVSELPTFVAPESAKPFILNSTGGDDRTPTIGSPYPSANFNVGALPAASIVVTTESEEHRTFRLTVVYEFTPDGGTEPPGPDEPARVEVGATLQSTQTGFEIVPITDAGGNPTGESTFGLAQYAPISVQYNAPTFNDDGTTDGNHEWTPKQAARVTYQRPLMTVRRNRRETSTPGDKAMLYVGRVNANHLENMNPSFIVQGDGPGNARMWMCTRITGTSVGAGTEFDVTYEFQLNVDWDPSTAAGFAGNYVSGWDPTVAFTKANGDIPLDILESQNRQNPDEPASNDLTTNKAIRRIQVFESIEYIDSPSGLPLSL